MNTNLLKTTNTVDSVHAGTPGIAANSTKHIGTSPATYEQQVMIACFIAIMAVWSTAGNLLTVFAITLHRQMLTKCNSFILSLAFSDLLSGLVASPLWLYRRTWGFYDWQWGGFLCKLFWFTDESTSYCTAMHIASFAVWRLIVVKWPSRFEGIEIRSIRVLLALLWCFALVFGGFLFSLFYDVEPKNGTGVSRYWPSCSIRIANHGVQQQKLYYAFSSTTFMICPLVVLALSSLLLVKELYTKKAGKSTHRKRKERKVSVQLSLIASSFLIGYVPMTIYVLWTTRTSSKDPLSDYWFNVAAYFCLRLSECINPLMYNIASSRMRKSSIRLLQTCRLCVERSYGSEPAGSGGSLPIIKTNALSSITPTTTFTVTNRSVEQTETSVGFV